MFSPSNVYNFMMVGTRLGIEASRQLSGQDLSCSVARYDAIMTS